MGQGRNDFDYHELWFYSHSKRQAAVFSVGDRCQELRIVVISYAEAGTFRDAN